MFKLFLKSTLAVAALAIVIAGCETAPVSDDASAPADQHYRATPQVTVEQSASAASALSKKAATPASTSPFFTGEVPGGSRG